MVGLAPLPEPRPKARNLPTRFGARDVGAQANRIRHVGPALRRSVEQASSAADGQEVGRGEACHVRRSHPWVPDNVAPIPIRVGGERSSPWRRGALRAMR
jgi:hypothetical protein